MASIIGSFPVVFDDTDALTRTGEVYAGMTDQLAGMIENSTAASSIPARIIAQRLGALHTELDELTVTPSSRRTIVRLTNQVNELIQFTAGQDGRIYEITTNLLTELHGALVDLVALYRWEVAA